MNDATFALPPGVAARPAAARPAVKLPFSRKTLLAVGGAVVLAAAGAAYIAMPKASVSTDAAYVEADSSVVAPRVKGLVAEVLVRAQPAGPPGRPAGAHRSRGVRRPRRRRPPPICRTPRPRCGGPGRARRARAGRAARRLQRARRQAVIRSADAQSERAQGDRQRYDKLVADGAVSRRDADTYKAAAISADSDAAKTRAQLDVSRNQVAVTAARRATPGRRSRPGRRPASPAPRPPSTSPARTRATPSIRAPIDGVVGDRQVEAGDYVQPGSRLLTLVPLKALYVTANFKETQVSRMVVGPAGDDQGRRPARPGAEGRGRQLRAGLRLAVLAAAVRAGHGEFHQDRPAGAGAHPLRARPAGLDRLRPGLLDDGDGAPASNRPRRRDGAA